MPELMSNEEVQFVLDGGALLQKIPWSRGSTYASIYQTYIGYVKNRFPNPIVVFDGYASGLSTKDATHLKWTRGKLSTNIQFTPDMTLQVRKDMFLAYPVNKQLFITQTLFS